MEGDAPSAHNAEPVVLEAQLGALRRQLNQRENALAVLNRRLLQLERGQNGALGVERATRLAPTSEPHPLEAVNQALTTENEALSAQVRALTTDNECLREELQRMRNTRLFRWAAPARGGYARIRRLR